MHFVLEKTFCVWDNRNNPTNQVFKHRNPDNKQTMGFPCLPELHPSAKDFMIDHVTIFAGKWANRRKLRSHAQFHFFHNLFKRVSMVSPQILFRPKGIYFQINRQKKCKKKDTPTPTPTPSRRFADKLVVILPFAFTVNAIHNFSIVQNFSQVALPKTVFYHPPPQKKNIREQFSHVLKARAHIQNQRKLVVLITTETKLSA